MKRAAVSVLYLAIGAAISALVASYASHLAEQYSWPLISTRWHGCLDTEHCVVPWWGYVVIALFIIGPAVAWGIVGFVEGRTCSPRQMIISAAALVLATALFYLGFYVAVWP